MSKQSILNWPVSERPRERALAEGVASLSDAELLAIILRTGTSQQNAVGLGRELLTRFKGLRGLFSAEMVKLLKVAGLGKAKAASLAAVSELARRSLKEEVLNKDFVHEPEAVMRYLSCAMRDLKRECFKVLYLDKAHRIMSDDDLFEGTVDQAAVHPREVVRAALEHHATSLVLVHNHPSGFTKPSAEDHSITKRLIDVCALVGIKVLDHIIVGDNRYFSFAQEGLI